MPRSIIRSTGALPGGSGQRARSFRSSEGRGSPRRCAGPLMVAAACLAAGFPVGSPTLAAQVLPLKTELPSGESFRCPGNPEAPRPDREERDQAARLASTATEAVILGDQERARDLLARAVQLDPTAGELAYQYARILEELGDDGAVDYYCRAVTLDTGTVDVKDARIRLEQLTATKAPELPVAAVASFRSGVSRAQIGRYESALQAFDRALEASPGWPEAVYDRGVVLDRLDRRDEAVVALRRYLELRPDAPDAIAVSERIGQLRNVPSGPSPATALTLGMVVPGMGQLYSGRTMGGLTVLSVAGGALAAGFLVREIDVQCLSDPQPGEACPDEHIRGEVEERPYLVPGIGVAAGVTLLAAVEAYFKLRGRGDGGTVASVDVGGAQLGALGVTGSPGGVSVRLVRWGF